MQAGFKLTVQPGTSRVDISTIWAVVGHTPAGNTTNFFMLFN